MYRALFYDMGSVTSYGMIVKTKMFCTDEIRTKHEAGNHQMMDAHPHFSLSGVFDSIPDIQQCT